MVLVKKTYEFNRGSYLIQTKFEIQNKSDKSIKSTAYYQLVHDGLSKEGSAFMPTFTGPAFYTEKVHFDKFNFNLVYKVNNSKIKIIKPDWINKNLKNI